MGKHKINEEPLNGKCSLCGGIYSKAAMRKHLELCTMTKKSLGSDTTRKRNTFHIVVEGVHHPEYWMRLEANADATLEDLDSFLRDTWLECCGHMSAFTIQKTRYIAGSGIDSMWVDMGFKPGGEKDMNTQVYAQCIYEGKGWLCDKCGRIHECGEDMLLPVVNSPRVGMCGYTG